MSIRINELTGADAEAVGTLAIENGAARDDLANVDPPTGRAALGLVIGDDVQPASANLDAFAGLTLVADVIPYGNGDGTLGLATIMPFGRSLIDDADAAGARATLELGSIATQAASAVAITGGTVTGLTGLSSSGLNIGTSAAANFPVDILGSSSPDQTMRLKNAGLGRATLVLDGGGDPAIDLRKAGVSQWYITSLAGSSDRLNVQNAAGATVLQLGQAGALTIASALTTGGAVSIGAADVVLTRDAANTLAQRNGANGQCLNIYGTYSDASNFERVELRRNGANFDLRTNHLGTGLPQPLRIYTSGAAALQLGTNGVISWNISTSGHVLPGVHNTYEIGSQALQINRIYGNLFRAQASSGRYVFDGTGAIGSPATGIYRLYDGESGNNVDIAAGKATGGFGIMGQAGAGTGNLNVFKTWTDNSNYEAFQIRGDASVSYWHVGTIHAGTGVGRGIQLRTNNQTRWQLEVDGTLNAGADNTYDIGSAAANRPKNINAASNVFAAGCIRPGSFTVSTVPSASAAGAGATIYVSNESGGSCLAFSDGTNWRRVSDRAVIS